MTTARVLLWGSDIGAVTWQDEKNLGVFQYTLDFARYGVEIAPLMMPLRQAPYEFPSLSRESFKGLPGLLADSLPDKFGNALIDAWLAGQGRSADSFNPVERLCYTGSRGMGALEFKPAFKEAPQTSRQIDIEALVELSNRILGQRENMTGTFSGEDDQRVIEDILRVGTSAGGARAKAVLAFNEKTGRFKSGQIKAESGYSHWLMKFDGVDGNKDKELADPLGFGRIEYAYSLMAREAGIFMSECRLHKEGGRAHFMTKRFDRTDGGEKLHMQSLGAMRHFDFNRPDAYSYEQALQTMRMLDLPVEDIEQQIRRTAFNLMARNQDDHVKNIAFLMNRRGTWRLSPAFDLAYSYNPDGAWTRHHQMSVNGKHDGFEVDDLIAFAAVAGFKKARTLRLLEEVAEAVRNWSRHADAAGMPAHDTSRIKASFRSDLM